MKDEYRRTHVYVERRSREPKYMFVCIGNIIEEYSPNKSDFSLLDVGGASGDFVHYFLERFPEVNAMCIDYDENLVKLGKERVPRASFARGDANNMTHFVDDQFDVVTMTGTHSIFDDFEPSFTEGIRVTSPGGLFVVTGIFNPYPVDVLMYWRRSGQSGGYMPGYNYFSQESVGLFLDKNEEVGSYEFRRFEFPLDLPPHEAIRSWSERRDDGSRLLRNGIMELSFYHLIVHLS